MAIDTATKRRMALGVGQLSPSVTPDAAHGVLWRSAVANGYAYIVVVLPIIRSWTLTARQTVMTLADRALSMTLLARSTATTLKDRDTDTTIQARDTAWTVEDR